jgi:hypothetical protein
VLLFSDIPSSGIFLPANLAAEVEAYYRSARIKSIDTTHLCVAAGLAIKNGRWKELRKRISRRVDSRSTMRCRAFLASH